MGGKAKSVYLTISLKGQFKTIFSKVFFDAASYRAYVDTDAFRTLWPTSEYDFVKETY